MKKLFLIAAAAAVLLTVDSCQKKEVDAPVIEEEGIVEVSFSLDGMDATVGTRALDTSLENSIKSVQIFVFRKGGAQDGKVDNAVYVPLNTAVSSTYQVSPFKCTVGDREAWTVVNAPEDYTQSVTTLAELKTKTVKLSDNADDSGQKLLMVGNVMTAEDGQTVVTKFTSGELKVKMKVARLVAGVRLAKVVNKMQVPSLQGSVSITGAYLMNVPGLQRLDGTLKASSASDIVDANWYAKNKKASSGPLVLLVQSAGSPVAVPYGDTGIAPDYLFYTLPTDIGGPLNDKTQRVESDGNKFRTSTYLVVEAKVGDIDCVYPVLLPEMEANKKYSVSLEINHIGGDPQKPWEKIKFTDFGASISITDWTSVDYPETI